MSNQPFGQAPAFGSPPPSPVDAPPVDETPARSTRTRTLVIAAVAGVAALGVLGGALVLTGTGDPAEESLALPAASTVPVAPSAAPTAVSTPLPTALVRSRNVFVPLVEEGGTDAEASAASEPAPAQPTGTATQATSGGTSFSPLPGSTFGSGSGSGGGSSAVPVIVYDPVVQDLLDAAVTEIARLEAEITELEGELREASDDSDLKDQIADLEAERKALDDTVADLQDQLDERDASRLLVSFVEATPTELTVVVDGEELVLLLDEETEVGTSGETPLNLTFLGLDETADPDLVSFTYVSGSSTVQLGATVSFPR